MSEKISLDSSVKLAETCLQVSFFFTNIANQTTK